MKHLSLKVSILVVAAAFGLSACNSDGSDSPVVSATPTQPGSGGSNITPSLSSVPAEYQDEVKMSKSIPVANDENNDSSTTASVVIDGKNLDKNANGEYEIDYSQLPNGYTRQKVSITRVGETTPEESYFHIYQQPYSIVFAQEPTNAGNGPSGTSDNRNFVEIIDGYETRESALDTLHNNNSSFTYKGVAFNGQQHDGVLSYTVDFQNRTGSGSITGLNEPGTITLNSAGFHNYDDDPTSAIGHGWGIQGTATAANAPGHNGNYNLGFFGPNAEEIAGKVEFGDGDPNDPSKPVWNEVGFAGTHQ